MGGFVFSPLNCFGACTAEQLQFTAWIMSVLENIVRNGAEISVVPGGDLAGF